MKKVEIIRINLTYNRLILKEFGMSRDAVSIHKTNKGLTTSKELYDIIKSNLTVIEDARLIVSYYEMSDLVLILNNSYSSIYKWIDAINRTLSYRYSKTVDKSSLYIDMIKSYQRTNGKTGVLDVELESDYVHKLLTEFKLDGITIKSGKSKYKVVSYEELYYIVKSNTDYINKVNKILVKYKAVDLARILHINYPVIIRWLRNLKSKDACLQILTIERTEEYMSKLNLSKKYKG